MNEQITILTSIFPYRIEQQQIAVKSWTDRGFRVISLNLADESAEVCPLFKDIEFLTVPRSPNHLIGSRIYLKEILETIGTLPGSIFGIVNSDLIFAADSDFADFISRHALDSMVFGSRIDLCPDQSTPGEESPFGFDYFFFNKNAPVKHSEADLCLGMPLWDYWLPLSAAMSGCSLKRIVSPIALHLKHEALWSEEHNDVYWPHLMKSVTELTGKQEDNDFELLPVLADDWRHCIHFVLSYLKYESTSIVYPEPANRNDSIALHNSSFSVMKNDLLLLAGKCRELEIEVRSITNSRSWRITAPFRAAAGCWRSILRLTGRGNGTSRD